MKGKIKTTAKLISVLLSFLMLVSSITIGGMFVFAAADDIDFTFSIVDSIDEPVDDATVSVFSDSGRNNKLTSEKSKDGEVTVSVEENDVYYYTVTADNMFDINGSFTKNNSEISVKMDYAVQCRTCHGSGEIECTKCYGTGEIEVESNCIDCSGSGKASVVCPECNGINSDSCTECAGAGTVEEDCTACNGTGKTSINESCDACSGTKHVVCTECGGEKKVAAYTDFEFKFDTNPNITYNSSNNPNPVTVEENTSKGEFSYFSDNENITVNDKGQISANKKANVGSQATITAIISFDKDNGYAPKKATCVVTVKNKADISANVTENNLTYNGDNQKLVTIANEDDYTTITYSGEGVNDDGTAKNAGTYNVKVTLGKGNNYNTRTVEKTVEIKPAELIVNPKAGQTKEFGVIPEIDYEIAGVYNDEITKESFDGLLLYEDFEIDNNGEIVDAEGDHLIIPGTLKLKEGIEANKNYTIKDINPANTKIHVNDVETWSGDLELPAGYYTDTNNNKWYNASFFADHSDVVITAPDGYKISTDRNYNYSDSVSFNKEQDVKDITVYLKKVETTEHSDSFWQGLIDFFDSFVPEELKSGKVENKTIRFGIDKTLPTLGDGKIAFDVENDNLLAAIGRLLTFGSFFNKNITATIPSSDNLSGVDVVDAKFIKVETQTNDDGTTAQIETTINCIKEDKKYVIESNEDSIMGSFYAIITDNAGNTNEILATSNNSNIADEDSAIIMIEKLDPEISDIVLTPVNEGRDSTYNLSENVKVFTGDADYNFNIQDNESGLYYVKTSINGTEVEYKYEGTNENQSYTVSTSGVEANADGEYILTVECSDAAGNYSTKTSTICVDKHAPIVKSFEITGVVGTADDTSVPHSVEATSYGFYFKDSAEVEVVFGDYKTDNEYLTGIRFVKIYLVDKDNEKFYEITQDGVMSEIDTVENVSAIPVEYLEEVEDETGDVRTFNFVVDKDFKGQIYAMAEDYAGNNLTNNAAPENSTEIIGEEISFNESGYQVPSGSIIESAEKHESQEIEHIVIKPTVEVIGKDCDGRDLYNDDVTVDITVSDTYSGVKTVELTVEAPYDTENNYSSKVEIGKDATSENWAEYSGDENEQDWEIGSFDENLATEINNSIIVSNNSNNIVVTVKLTDRAGNTSEESIEFSIDKSKPVITVEYDNNNVQNDRYYQDSRTATITIKELNFTEELVDEDVYEIGEDNLLITEILDGVNQNVDNTFTKSELKTETDENGAEIAYYEYTKKVTCSMQGDYSLTMTATDNAQNKSDYDRVDEFSLDTASPYITVTFDVDDSVAATPGYFSVARTATITVNDRYFDALNTSVVVTATDNGSPITAPAAGSWSQQTTDYNQSCTISFVEDATYSFTVDSTDKSGKSANQYVVGDFTIDNIDPVIKIYINDKELKNGDKIALIDDVEPRVEVEDTNYSYTDTTVTLVSTIKKDNVNLDNQQTVISKDVAQTRENGMVYDYNNFKGSDGHRREYDNIYTLSVETKDIAGRTTEPVTVQFSVNRYGSNYIYNIEEYYNEAPVIDVTEICVNPLDFENENTYVEVDSNSGTSQILNSQVTIIESIEAGKENWYEYHYAIPSDCFKVDDFYSIKLSSVDTAQRFSTNVNEEINDADISFTVDTTNPYFEVTNYKEGDDSVHEETFPLNIKLQDDTSGIAKYIVKFDGEVVASDSITENYQNEIPLTVQVDGATKLADAAGRKLEIEIWDAATNTNTTKTYNVRISTNLFVNALAKMQDFYSHTLIFWCTMAGMVLVIGGLIFATVSKKRKKAEDNATV